MSYIPLMRDVPAKQAAAISRLAESLGEPFDRAVETILADPDRVYGIVFAHRNVLFSVADGVVTVHGIS